MTENFHYLYHIRDPERSAGFGFDGYVGITDNPSRRKRQHMRAASKGQHPNPRFQKLYDESGGKLEMRIVRWGTVDEVSASEALVINRPNKHANRQSGGGQLRGKSEDELLRMSGLGSVTGQATPWRAPAGMVTPQQVALIVAAGLAITAGACYAYHRFRKSKLKTECGIASKSELQRPVPSNDLAARRAKIAEQGVKRPQGSEQTRRASASDQEVRKAMAAGLSAKYPSKDTLSMGALTIGLVVAANVVGEGD